MTRMKIWYLSPIRIDSIEADVVAYGAASYFIWNANKSKLLAVPRHMVVAKLHASSNEYVPSIVEFIYKNEGRLSEGDIDYSLSDKVNMVH